jgi:hypothetical protein
MDRTSKHSSSWPKEKEFPVTWRCTRVPCGCWRKVAKLEHYTPTTFERVNSMCIPLEDATIDVLRCQLRLILSLPRSSFLKPLIKIRRRYLLRAATSLRCDFFKDASDAVPRNGGGRVAPKRGASSRNVVNFLASAITTDDRLSLPRTREGFQHTVPLHTGIAQQAHTSTFAGRMQNPSVPAPQDRK